MEMSQIVAEIDAEIQRLQQARNLLSSAAGGSSSASAPAPARKPAATKAPRAVKSTGGKRKRNLSPEGRARIQEALKKRWEEHRRKQGK